MQPFKDAAQRQLGNKEHRRGAHCGQRDVGAGDAQRVTQTHDDGAEQTSVRPGQQSGVGAAADKPRQACAGALEDHAVLGAHQVHPAKEHHEETPDAEERLGAERPFIVHRERDARGEEEPRRHVDDAAHPEADELDQKAPHRPGAARGVQPQRQKNGQQAHPDSCQVGEKTA